MGKGDILALNLHSQVKTQAAHSSVFLSNPSKYVFIMFDSDDNTLRVVYHIFFTENSKPILHLNEKWYVHM